MPEIASIVPIYGLLGLILVELFRIERAIGSHNRAIKDLAKEIEYHNRVIEDLAEGMEDLREEISKFATRA